MSYLSEKLESADAVEQELVEVCPLCGGENATFLFWNFDRLYHLPGKFGTCSCDDCGLIRLSPRPTLNSIGLYYPEDYGAYVTPNFSALTVSENGLVNFVRNSVLSGRGYKGGNFPHLQKLLGPVLTRPFFIKSTYGYGELFPKYVDGGRALEIGCGNGLFLSYLKRHGWNVNGLDLSSHAAEKAKEIFDIDVFVGSVDDALFASESFDYIHMSHVVEHFFDPLESMKKVFSLLAMDGTVYVEVPNAHGIGADMSGRYWYGWDAPRHLFMFTPESLRKLLQSAGFRVEHLTTSVKDFFDWEMTYRYEDASGRRMETRPSVKEADLPKAEALRLESERRFKKRRGEGDFIHCWASKLPSAT